MHKGHLIMLCWAEAGASAGKGSGKLAGGSAAAHLDHLAHANLFERKGRPRLHLSEARLPNFDMRCSVRWKQAKTEANQPHAFTL